MKCVDALSDIICVGNLRSLQKMGFSITRLFHKCDQIRRKLRIWSHSVKKSVMENIIFCAEGARPRSLQDQELLVKCKTFAQIVSDVETEEILLNAKCPN